MNRALRIVFSRYGIIVIILVLVLLVIALAETRDEAPLDGTNPSTNGANGTNGGATSEAITADDGVATEACAGDDCYPEVELPQEAVDRAVAFTEAWLNPYQYGPSRWYDSIAPFLTTANAELMQGVDPVGVPAEAITGEAIASDTKVAIPLDTGTLTLTMIEGANDWTANGWLVSAIDWEQS